MKRLSWFMVLGVVAAMAIPASAQTESSFVMASNVQGSSEGYNSIDPLYGSLHSFTRAINAKHCISYGVIDWAAADLAGRNSAGEQSRLANWASADDNYESLAHWGAGHVNDPFRQTRGMVRYDEDTFLAMNTQYDATNANNARPPFLQQIEVYEDWFKDSITTDDQWAFNGIARYDLLRAGSRPFAVDNVYEWGPEPDFTLDPNLPVDWTWVGGGATGVLQWPDGSNAGQYTYTWSTGDPNEVTREYATGIDGPRGFMKVDNAAADLYVSEFIPQGTIVAGGTSTPTRSSGAEIDVAVWYGGAEDDAHRIYTAQFNGRVYKVEAAKQLGYSRLAGAPYPGARVTGTDHAKPLCTQTDGTAPRYYDADYESGQPLLGDGPLQPSGAGAYTVELYSDAKAGERHYTGLAVDAGGRVYAASERLTEAGFEVDVKFTATGADVWADYLGVGNHLLYDPNNAPFGTDVVVNDTVLLLAGGGSTDTTKVYTVDTVLNDSQAYLNLNPGDSLLAGDVTYVVYPAGVHPRGSQLKVDSQDETVSTATVATNVLTDTSQNFTGAGVVAGDLIEIFYSGDPNDGWSAGTYTVVSATATTVTTDPNGASMGIHPITDPNYTTSGDNGVPYTVFGTFSNIWTSEALVDVYRDGGEPIYTIDLNALTRKDTVALSTYYHDGTDAGSQIINGVVIHGDIEVDPTVSGGDVTRLWIACANGDGNPDTNDGLGMVVVDVNIAQDGTVSGVDFVAGIDDGDMYMGLFYNGSYNSSNYQPYNLFMPAQDIEFDGQGNLVYMANRGGNDNRYNGFTAAALATAVDTALNDPNELDGIVGVAGLPLDMNVYGFGTDFGLAFTNSPLVNAGSANGPATPPQAYVAPDVNDPADMIVPVAAFSHQMEIAAGTGLPAAFTWQLVGTVPGDMAIDANGLITWTVQPGDDGQTFYVNAGAYNIVGYDEETFGITVQDAPVCTATLVSSDPAADGTLPKKANNCLFLTFDEAITVNAGETLSIVACNGGADVSASFTYSVEVDGVTLKVAENGEALTNQTWYRISEGTICVAPFTLDVCTLVGDADGNGQVLAGDLGKIWSKNAQIGPCFREDTDGNGQVLAGDLGLTWSHNAELPPAKVCP